MPTLAVQTSKRKTTANIQKRQECIITSAPSTAASGSATITSAPSILDSSAASASASASGASASAASASAASASAASASAASASAASASAVSASAASASAASASAAAASASAAAAIANKANCYLWDDASLAYAIQVTPIDGWTTGSNGKSLKNEEKGCGALMFWHWGTWSKGTQWATFELPTWIKAGCVERAIASAGGPSGLKCRGMGWFHGRYLREDGTIRGGGTGGEDGVLAQGEAEATASLLPLAVPGAP
ncbi:uncharacterized protein LTHEOB_11496 [Lasiodiplodia theobromae]|uniref:uncharacterized protein n=1 Tax=Lasiodiplodia theobromae TaxID=45133 RepID=UPI0015C3C0AA|nr:uncharacterized protein LTHEOB_11496 [Lasiodiplodia theobromae]KAF4537724.1 hypothetical protein LTHEOB_11496 [Lasiodiplodia theobromae]